MKEIIFLTTLILLVSCGNSIENKEIPKKSDTLQSRKFKMDYDGHIYVNCTITNHIDTVPLVFVKKMHDAAWQKKIHVTGNFLFDTGADGLLFDSLFFKNSGFQYHTDSTCLKGVGENLQYGRVILDQINLNFLKETFTSEYNVITDLRQTFGKRIDGVLGWDFLKDRVVVINYPDSSIEILDPKNLKIDKGYQKIPIVIKNKRIFLESEIRISDTLTIKGEFWLDLGFAGAVCLSSKAVEKYHLGSLSNQKINYISSHSGIGGKSSGFVFRGESVKLSVFEVPDLEIICSKSKTGGLSTFDDLGLIGNKIFERFSVVLDFKNKNLYLKPNSNFKSEFKSGRSGFAFADRTDISNGWIVRTLYLESNADKAGILIGDTITHINGRSVKDITAKQAAEYFGKAGEKVELRIKRGKKNLKYNLDLRNYLY